MAPAVAIKDRGAAGDLFFRIVDLTLDATYIAAGWPITPQQVGFGSNGTIFGVTGIGTRGGFLFEWDHVNNKLLVRDSSGGVGAVTPEVANNLAGLNAIVVRAIFWGKGQG